MHVTLVVRRRCGHWWDRSSMDWRLVAWIRRLRCLFLCLDAAAVTVPATTERLWRQQWLADRDHTRR